MTYVITMIIIMLLLSWLYFVGIRRSLEIQETFGIPKDYRDS